MDELNLDQAPQDVNKEELQLDRVCLQAFVAVTDPGYKKELFRNSNLGHRTGQANAVRGVVAHPVGN
ncbi:hypothetical protein TNCV_1704061 [Trichonephila clavipes]|nr:hypothetical protein TNCV_1704061 [Trichonephila clavipes]